MRSKIRVKGKKIKKNEINLTIKECLVTIGNVKKGGYIRRWVVIQGQAKEGRQLTTGPNRYEKIR